MAVSRTKRTIQNSKVSLILFVIQIFVGFYSRKIFLEHLGDEVIGLNTTLGNILNFLNLAELGIGLAMGTSLYKPLHNQDQKQINEIITVLRFLYKRIALLICLLSIPILIALPIIFPATECSILYTYLAYIVFLSGSLFSYLWNYKEILIQADQKSFKLMPWVHGVRYTKIFTQICLLLFTSLGIWGWIFMEFIGDITNVFVINYVIHKEYPWLHLSSTSSKFLLKKYHYLIIKTKQIFVHKIAGYVLYQTSPLIIYTYVSLTIVTHYSNYMMLIGYCISLISVIYGGMAASIGNLIVESNKQHTMDVFWELFTSRIWIGGIACFMLYICIGPFISLWIGHKYILDESTLLLLILYMYINISRSVIESFRDAYQLFGDIWAPLIEASINLGGSILFGYLWGLNGVLIGVNLSLIIIVLLWKPYYIFRHGIKSSVWQYYRQYVLHLSVLIVCAIFVKIIIDSIYCNKDNYIELSLIILLGISTYTIITCLILLLCTKGMRMFATRVRKIITHKI